MSFFIGNEINSAIKSLSLEAEVARLPEAQAESIKNEIQTKFVNGSGLWWEHFVEPTASVWFKGGDAHQSLTRFTPKPAESCWLLFESPDATGLVMYELTPNAAVKILGECAGCEYYLVSKDLDWLICENDHDVLIGSGDAVVRAMSVK